jgi:hypothetical protein
MSDEDIAATVLAGLIPNGGLISRSPTKDAGQMQEQDSKKETKGQNKSTRKYNKKTKVEPKFPVEPRIIQVIKKPKTYVDHSYRDFSSVPADVDYEAPNQIQEMNFPLKLHDILSNEAHFNFITWMPHGRSFRIDVPVLFEKEVCEKYYNHKRYSSFLRQLNTHGFKHLTKGQDRNSYYHEVSCFYTRNDQYNVSILSLTHNVFFFLCVS